MSKKNLLEKIDSLESRFSNEICEQKTINRLLAEKLGYTISEEDFIDTTYELTWLGYHKSKKIKQRPILLPIKKSNKRTK